MKNINVLVKKWFDKINGNTYHSVTFEFKNEVYFSGLTYGYERMYEQTFKEMVKKAYPNRNIKLYNVNYNVKNNCLKRQLNELY